jgi:hypothetical protein
MPTPVRRRYFKPKLERARRALQQRSEEAVDVLFQAAHKAAEKGNARPAQWILEHLGELDADGKEIRVVMPGVDLYQARPEPAALPQLPGVTIGFLLPGAVAPAAQFPAAPAQVIDASFAVTEP